MENDDKTIDDLITIIQNEMANLTPGHEDYKVRLERLEKLYAIKAQNRPPRISYDTMLTVGGNILMVVVMVGYERSHVMVSKALSLLNRPK